MLRLANFNEQNYTITGPTDDWTDELRLLGGVYHNKRWLFDKSKVEVKVLQNFMTLVNSKKMIPSDDSSALAYNLRRMKLEPNILPIYNTPSIKTLPLEYQNMTYLLPAPKVGNFVVVLYQGVNYKYEIVSRKFNGVFSTSFEMQYNNFPKVTVIIRNGKWVIDLPNIGFHTLQFL